MSLLDGKLKLPSNYSNALNFFFRNHFEVFEPFTNLLWLHYIIDKLINGARYRLTKTKKHRSNIHAMMQLRDELLDYKSATNYVQCL